MTSASGRRLCWVVRGKVHAIVVKRTAPPTKHPLHALVCVPSLASSKYPRQISGVVPSMTASRCYAYAYTNHSIMSISYRILRYQHVSQFYVGCTFLTPDILSSLRYTLWTGHSTQKLTTYYKQHPSLIEFCITAILRENSFCCEYHQTQRICFMHKNTTLNSCTLWFPTTFKYRQGKRSQRRVHAVYIICYTLYTFVIHTYV